VKPSTELIHFGIAASSPARGRFRHCFTASPGSTRPRTSFSVLVESEGAPLSVGSDAPTTESRIAPAMAIATIHPARNERLSDWALSVPSISTIATMGIGLMAMPTANGSIWPMACPTAGDGTRVGRWWLGI
jgi:hypothetical protein